MRRWKRLSGALLLGCCQVTLGQPQLRRDALAAAELLCRSAKASTQDYWQRGLYDAQIIGSFVKPEKLPTQALQFAKQQERLGYAYGLCDAHKAWVLAFHSPEPLLRNKAQGYRAPLAALQANCSRYSVDRSESHYAVTCVSKTHSSGAELLWFLAPLGPTATLPALASLQGSPEAALSAWVAALRQAAGLGALQPHAALQSSAQVLLQRNEPLHQAALLQEQQQALRVQRLTLLGEDRALGRDALELATLLWASPRHRALLLHKAAQFIGLQVHETQQGLLLSLLVASP